MFVPGYSSFPLLPCNVQSCVTHGINQDCSGIISNISCDEVIGSKALGYGYCSETDTSGGSPSFKSQFCACVNSTVACPHLMNDYCANEPYAYKTAAMKSSHCEKNAICSNVMNVRGSQNIENGIVQNCTSDIKNDNIVLPIPYLSISIFLFILAVVIYVLVKLTVRDVRDGELA